MTDYCRKDASRACVYHDADDKGRPECLVGNNADYEFEIVDVDELGDEAVYCDHCAGEVVQESNVGSARASQLAKMSPEQLGLSPMGDRP